VSGVRIKGIKVGAIMQVEGNHAGAQLIVWLERLFSSTIPWTGPQHDNKDCSSATATWS
jgi:hypothetical protein